MCAYWTQLLSIPVFAGHHIISREVPRVLEIVYAEPRADDYIVRATKHGVLVSKMIYIGVVFYASAMGSVPFPVLYLGAITSWTCSR